MGVRARVTGVAHVTSHTMWTIIAVILVVWLAVSVLGFVLEGLLWLGIIGLVLFGATLLYGFIKGRSPRV